MSSNSQNERMTDSGSWTEEELKETEAYIQGLKAALQQKAISKSWTPYYDSQEK